MATTRGLYEAVWVVVVSFGMVWITGKEPDMGVISCVALAYFCGWMAALRYVGHP